MMTMINSGSIYSTRLRPVRFTGSIAQIVARRRQAQVIVRQAQPCFLGDGKTNRTNSNRLEKLQIHASNA